MKQFANSPAAKKVGRSEQKHGFARLNAGELTLRKGRPGYPQLLRDVRQFARSQQKDEAQPFFSLRRAAEEFGASLPVMVSVYRELTNEGILRSVRGSKTLLEGRQSGRTLKVRAVVMIPLSVPRMQMFREYRECSLFLRRELHARGFAVVAEYFESLDIKPEAIANAARREKVDVVIWPRAHGIPHDTALRLRDLGVRFAGVNVGGVAGGFCRYEVRRRHAIAIILHEWSHVAKLREAVLVRAGPEGVGEQERFTRTRGLANDEKIGFEVATIPEGQIMRLLQRLAKKRAAVLLAASAATILGSRATDDITEVLQECRVALMDGPIEFPFASSAPDAVVDLVAVDWTNAATRIAQDLLTGHAFRDNEMTAFEASAYLRVPVGWQPGVAGLSDSN